jgi:hypothetical protein
VQPLVMRQSDCTLHLELHQVLVNPVNHQQELEQLLFLLQVQQQAVQLQLDCTHHQEPQTQMDSQASLQQDSSFRQEVLLVQETEIQLFPPFIPISGLLQLVVLEHPITQFSTQTLEPLKVQVLQPQVTLP